MSGEKPYGTGVLSPSARYDWATSQDGPGTASTVFSGAYRSSHLEEVIG